MGHKERILEKATDLFMRYGIRSITMDEIATQLGVSKKTLYQFFADKDAMVEAVMNEETKRNEEGCRQFRLWLKTQCTRFSWQWTICRKC
jgi:AcrR family transcriptional regulator